ncbi:MAG: hypothetical protein WC775_02105 [Patescibacteria group bacterium]
MNLEQTATLRELERSLSQRAELAHREPCELLEFWRRFYELLARQIAYRERAEPEFCDVPELPWSTDAVRELVHDGWYVVYMPPEFSEEAHRPLLMSVLPMVVQRPEFSPLDLTDPHMPVERESAVTEGWVAVRPETPQTLMCSSTFPCVIKALESRVLHPATLNMGIVTAVLHDAIMRTKPRPLMRPSFLCMGTSGGVKPTTAHLDRHTYHGIRYLLDIQPQPFGKKSVLTIAEEPGPEIPGMCGVLAVRRL